MLRVAVNLRKLLHHFKAGNQLGLIRPDFMDRKQVPLWVKEFAHIRPRHTVHAFKPFLLGQQTVFYQLRLEFSNTRSYRGLRSQARGFHAQGGSTIRLLRKPRNLVGLGKRLSFDHL